MVEGWTQWTPAGYQSGVAGRAATRDGNLRQHRLGGARRAASKRCWNLSGLRGGHAGEQPGMEMGEGSDTQRRGELWTKFCDSELECELSG